MFHLMVIFGLLSSQYSYAAGYYNLAMFWKTSSGPPAVCSISDPKITFPAENTATDSGAFDFSVVTIGATKRLTLELDNSTSTITASALADGTTAMANGFGWAGGTFPGTLGDCTSGGSLASPGFCNLDVSFTPASRGAATSTVYVNYNNANSVTAASRAVKAFGTKSIVPVSVAKSFVAHTTCAIMSDGTLKCWGLNTNGMAGSGDTVVRGDNTGEMSAGLVNVNLGTSRTAKQVAIGTSHACAVLDNNTVKCWGNGASGRLGYGDTITRDTATKLGDSLPIVNLGAGRTAKKVGAGSVHSCALLDNNTIKCWGDGGNGVLGNESNAIIGDQSTEAASLPTTLLGTGRTAKDLAVGETSNCAILDNDQVKCWGYGNGLLGYGDLSLRGQTTSTMGDLLPYVNLGTGRTAKKISIASYMNCAILDNNDSKCWGSAYYMGDATDRGDNAGEMGDSLLPIDWGTSRYAKTIAAGRKNVCAILDDDTLKCFGNEFGDVLPITGDGYRGDSANEMGTNLPAFNLGTGRTPIEVAVGFDAACALLDNFALKCWGIGTNGELGYGDTTGRGGGAGSFGNTLPFVEVYGYSPVSYSSTSYTLNGNQTGYCVNLLYNNKIKCVGTNTVGQLGVGDTTARGSVRNQMGSNLASPDMGTLSDNSNFLSSQIITAGSGFFCAVDSAEHLKCWGGNGSASHAGAAAGELGYGDVANRGNTTNMGASLPIVDFGAGRSVKSLSGAGAQYYSFNRGTNHSCYLLDNNTIKCFGSNAAGQLGYGDTTNRGDYSTNSGSGLAAVSIPAVTPLKVYTGGSMSCFTSTANQLYCWGGNGNGQSGLGDTIQRGDASTEMGAALAPVDFGTGRTIKELVPGLSFHQCAILDDNSLKCWGLNTNGQLGYGDTTQRGSGAGQMSNSLPAVDLGAGRTIVQASVGTDHSCAVLDDATLKCWGGNSVGQLGYGDTTDRGTAGGTMGASLPAISLGTSRTALSVLAGSQKTCVLLDNFRVKCWGANASNFGNGNEDTVQRGDGASEMGDFNPYIEFGSEY